MGKIREWIEKIVPLEHLMALIAAFSFNMLVYNGSRLFTGGLYHHNIEGWLDRMIPFFAPSAAIYLGCYLFWAVNYVLIARQEKQKMCAFFAADILSRVICLLFFCLFPTTNIRPQVPESGFWNQVMRMVYEVDAADNLFPSIHCLVSWFCYIGIRGRQEIPCWYRGFSCVMALLVCVSTLTTKQHVIPDVVSGVLLAEFCFWIGKMPAVWKTYERLLDKINALIFRQRGGSA